jgi:REP element-mobilizing transposase RayT
MANGTWWEGFDPMPKRKREDAPNTIHHIIQRGNNHNYIYGDTLDKQKFFSILSTAITTYDMVLLQYVLMDNHYHLLVRMGNQPLSEMIWFLNRNYSLYYNQRYNRTGTIYEGRYKSYLLTENQKLFSTVRYIVRNPVKAGLAATPLQYRWSGHASVLKDEAGFIDRAALLAFFAPDDDVALKRYMECTEHEAWSAEIGFATILDRKNETEERLCFLLDRFLSELNLPEHQRTIVSGGRSPLSYELRNSFTHLAIADGHSQKDIAAFLRVSPVTVRRIGGSSGKNPHIDEDVLPGRKSTREENPHPH